MRLRIGGAVVHRDFDFSRVWDASIRDAGGERCSARFIEKPVDLMSDARRMVNLHFTAFTSAAVLRVNLDP